MILNQCWTDKTMLILAHNRCKWFSHILASVFCKTSLSDLYHIWLHNSITMLPCNGRHRHPNIIRFTLSTVITLDDERLWVIQNKLFQSPCNPLHRFGCQRPHSTDSILFLNFLRCVKYRWTRTAEINLRICPDIWL